MAQTPHYNHQDIARYLQRTMSPQEMHAFERALMDDPFLADALEGFSTANPPLAEKHLTAINQQIAGQRNKSKIIPLLPRKNSWWKVAIVVLVVAVGSFFSYSLFRQKQDGIVVAQNKATGSRRQSAIQPNSTVQAEQPAAASGEAERKRSTVAPSEPESRGSAVAPGSGRLASPSPKRAPLPATNNSPSADTVDLSMMDIQLDKAKSDSVVPAPVLKKEVAMARMKASAPAAINEFKGKVVDKSGEPVPFASVVNNKTHASVSTDANGGFLLKEQDSVVNITIQGVGYQPATANLENKEGLHSITLEKGSQALGEVVIVGYGAQNKKSTPGAASSTAAEPVGGWKNFRQYLDRQIDSLQATKSKYPYISEDVVLEFFVDDKGNPSNIQVPEPANQAAASKAVEILANGPKWRNKKKDQKVKVVIPFKSGN